MPGVPGHTGDTAAGGLSSGERERTLLFSTRPAQRVAGSEAEKGEMVPVEGVEPPTFALRMRCSTS